MSKTISITIPDNLERELQDHADKIGVSRSRYIGNILLGWSEKNVAKVAESEAKQSE